MGSGSSKKNIYEEDNKTISQIVNRVYENASVPNSFGLMCGGTPLEKQSIDIQISFFPGDILLSHKRVAWGNWVHSGIFDNNNCFYHSEEYMKQMKNRYSTDYKVKVDDNFPKDRVSFSVNHAAYPRSLQTVSFLRPIGEIISLSDKENIIKFKDFREKNFYDQYPSNDKTIIIRRLRLKENLSIGLTEREIKKLSIAVRDLSKYFVENKLKYGGICKLGSKCSELLPKDIKSLMEAQIKKMENIREAELICSSFAILTWQLVLFLTGHLDILNKVLPFNAEACLPRNIGNLHKTLPEYWEAKTYVFGCSMCDLNSFN